MFDIDNYDDNNNNKNNNNKFIIIVIAVCLLIIGSIFCLWYFTFTTSSIPASVTAAPTTAAPTTAAPTTAAPTTAAPTYNMIANNDYVSNDIGNVILGATNCQKICNNDPNCAGYIIESNVSSEAANCWNKSKLMNPYFITSRNTFYKSTNIAPPTAVARPTTAIVQPTTAPKQSINTYLATYRIAQTSSDLPSLGFYKTYMWSDALNLNLKNLKRNTYTIKLCGCGTGIISSIKYRMQLQTNGNKAVPAPQFQLMLRIEFIKTSVYKDYKIINTIGLKTNTATVIDSDFETTILTLPFTLSDQTRYSIIINIVNNTNVDFEVNFNHIAVAINYTDQLQLQKPSTINCLF